MRQIHRTTWWILSIYMRYLTTSSVVWNFRYETPVGSTSWCRNITWGACVRFSFEKLFNGYYDHSTRPSFSVWRESFSFAIESQLHCAFDDYISCVCICVRKIFTTTYATRFSQPVQEFVLSFNHENSFSTHIYLNFIHHHILLLEFLPISDVKTKNQIEIGNFLQTINIWQARQVSGKLHDCKKNV